jgi:hypothetical protein
VKTYTRKGVTVYCLDTFEAAKEFLTEGGFAIKRPKMPSLDAALAWYRRSVLERKEARIVKWGDYYAYGEK